MVEAKEHGSLLEDNDPSSTTFQKGEKVEITSQDTNSGKVERASGVEQGSEKAPQEFEGNDKDLETKTGSEQKEGAEEAAEEFEGSKKAISDDFKFAKGSDKKVASAEGASKDFGNYREQIRAAMRGGIAQPINKPEFKGNQGLNK